MAEVMKRLLLTAKTKALPSLLGLCALVVFSLPANAYADIPFGYKVQSGRVEVTGSSLDVPITTVSDMSRAFVLISPGTGYASTNTNADIVQARGYLQAVNNVRIERTSTSNSTWVSYQVIECLNQEFTVYRGQDSLTSAETSKTLSIGATVTPANCLAFVTADNDIASRAQYYQAMLTARASSATEVTIERNGSGSVAPNFNWVVVEFDTSKIGSIEHGSVTADSVTYSSPQTVTIGSVDLANSILIFQARPNANGLARTAWAGNFNSSTEIKFYQHTATSAADIEWYVIDFNDGSAQRGMLDESSNTAWLTSDATLSPSVDTTKTMHFHSMTCNGNGNAYPRAMSTAEFTSSTNLRIQRMGDGQESYIEWQVLELPTGVLDTTPPTPDPLTWASVPTAMGPNSITMTASTATDANSPPVMYYFECTTHGDANSDWQTSETYVAQSLDPGTEYTFRVKARDSAPALNETGWSPPASATTYSLVPDVVDMNETDANSAITAVGLVVGTVTYEHNDTIAADVIISQNPDANTAVPIGSSVDLVVSLGQPEVPNVVDMNEADANSAITAVDNLTVGTVTYDYSDTIADGNIISQNPGAGTAVPIGSSVDLVVSLGQPVVP
ncbi:MAG: PASTA domain-containing protein, partial [Planctomycetota bacterium]